MPSEAAFAAERALLGELAQLSLAVARDLSAAITATDDTSEMVRLADAYAKVGRCLRMAVALSVRLARGQPLAPAREPREERLEVERDDFDVVEERLERENLYDRLPSGDLPTQIATVARTLRAAAKVLPAPAAASYRTRFEALVAAPHADTEPTRSRGPPQLN